MSPMSMPKPSEQAKAAFSKLVPGEPAVTPERVVIQDVHLEDAGHRKALRQLVAQRRD